MNIDINKGVATGVLPILPHRFSTLKAATRQIALKQRD
jgi:hypothetical protein